MDEHGSWHGEVDPTGCRRVVGRPAAGDAYVLPVAGGAAWGYEGEAPRQTAHALLADLTGFAPLAQMTWSLASEVVARFGPRSGWTLDAEGLDAWRRDWVARPEHRGHVERAFVGALLRDPQPVEVDPSWLRDRRERVLVQAVLAAARVGVEPDVGDLQRAVDALRLGDAPDLVVRRLRAAPEGPGPHWWAARVRAHAAA